MGDPMVTHIRNTRSGPAWCGAGFFVKLFSFLRRDLVTCRRCQRMAKARGF